MITGGITVIPTIHIIPITIHTGTDIILDTGMDFIHATDLDYTTDITGRTYLIIPRGRDSGICGAVQEARSEVWLFQMNDERRSDASQTPLSLRVAHHKPALCVNRLGNSYGYSLHLAP